MIVTADALGDFNATSQILRYSALAREVTVPRIPSIASTIFGGKQVENSTSGRNTPALVNHEKLAIAAAEMGRLSEELEIANIRLAEEQDRRHEAELAWKAAQEQCIVIEQAVREECWAESESKIEEERRRWKLAWCEEVNSLHKLNLKNLCLPLEKADRNDEHLDQKLEVLTRTIQSTGFLTPRFWLKSMLTSDDSLRRS